MHITFRYFRSSSLLLLLVVSAGWIYECGKPSAELSSSDAIVTQSESHGYNSWINPRRRSAQAFTVRDSHHMGVNKEEYNTPRDCHITASRPELRRNQATPVRWKARRPQEAIVAFQALVDAPPAKSRLKRLGDFTLTAYTVEYPSTGKRPTSPAFGITFSGSHAEILRTVAVDPSVIPIGTPILIEGIGWRLAEDTGGAVKGKHIDVLLPTEDAATRFGIKRHIAVYEPDSIH